MNSQQEGLSELSPAEAASHRATAPLRRGKQVENAVEVEVGVPFCVSFSILPRLLMKDSF
jgi:hypothetical protein